MQNKFKNYYSLNRDQLVSEDDLRDFVDVNIVENLYRDVTNDITASTSVSIFTSIADRVFYQHDSSAYENMFKLAGEDSLIIINFSTDISQLKPKFSKKHDSRINEEGVMEYINDLMSALGFTIKETLVDVKSDPRYKDSINMRFELEMDDSSFEIGIYPNLEKGIILDKKRENFLTLLTKHKRRLYHKRLNRCKHTDVPLKLLQVQHDTFQDRVNSIAEEYEILEEGRDKVKEENLKVLIDKVINDKLRREKEVSDELTERLQEELEIREAKVNRYHKNKIEILKGVQQ